MRDRRVVKVEVVVERANASRRHNLHSMQPLAARGQIVRRDPAGTVVSWGHPLYFQHIPKTAGVSVHSFLDRRFPAEMVCPEVLWDGLIAMPHTQALSYTVYRGHFFGYLDAFLSGPTVKFTLLREPTARTISHFLHVRRTRTHPLHEVVSAQTLLEFVSSPLTRHMVRDLQARYLASSDDDISVVARQFSPKDLEAFKLQTYLETLPLPGADVLYERARAALDSCAFVGTSDRFDDSMERLAKLFDLPPHVPFEPQNVVPADERIAKLDAKTADAIAAATEVDRELYELASSRQPAQPGSSTATASRAETHRPLDPHAR